MEIFVQWKEAMDYLPNDVAFSPLIRDGGGLGHWLETFIYSMLSLVVVDVVFTRQLKKGRWFTLHTFANAIITAFSLPDLIFLIFDPVNALQSQDVSSCIPLMMNLSIHVYHTVVFYYQLSSQDILHHSLMTFVAIPVAFLQRPGPILNASHVFVTGLPGGCNYAHLAMVKNELMHTLTEKRINCAMNVWCRSPGILLVSYLSWVQMFFCMKQYNMSSIEITARMINIILYIWNAQYFMERVVGNYHIKQWIDNEKAKKGH